MARYKPRTTTGKNVAKTLTVAKTDDEKRWCVRMGDGLVPALERTDHGIAEITDRKLRREATEDLDLLVATIDQLASEAIVVATHSPDYIVLIALEHLADKAAA